MKRKIIFTLIISFLLSATNVWSQRIDSPWALKSLLAPDIRTIDKAIETLTPGKQKSESENLALGILHINKYIRGEELKTAKSSDVFKANSYLGKISSTLAEEPLTLVYMGMTSAFLASIKTVFGVGDLKSMEKHFSSISENEKDWFIRYLRGITLVKVGRGLPPMPFFTNTKKQAVETGMKDLTYVRSEENRGVVPREIAGQIDALLSEDTR